MGLNLIKKEGLKKKVTKNFSYRFAVEKAGIYAIVVGARAKSWIQNTIKFISFFRDDNLAIKINEISFPNLSNNKEIFNGEASWNGNKLKGLQQINLIVVSLKKGEQNLYFLASGSPILDLIEIYRVEGNDFVIQPAEKYGVEEGNRRPWFKILTADVGVKTIFVKASAGVKKNEDDDDLQIKIDGVRVENKMLKAHKCWYWCGRVLRGESRAFEKDLNFQSGVHYLEFWADGSPNLQEIKLDIKRIPSVDDPFWTGDFNDDPDDILFTRLIFGEARSQPDEARRWVASVVLNRKESPTAWPDTIRGVILDRGQFDALKLKINDQNFDRVIDPLGVSSDEGDNWFECYKIVKEAIEGRLELKTEATHFHSYTKPEDIERFEKNVVPNGKFLKKIGSLYFYWSPN